jgi:hypothetical protein
MNNSFDFSKLIESLTKDKKSHFFVFSLSSAAILVFSIIYDNREFAYYGLAMLFYSFLANIVRETFYDVIIRYFARDNKLRNGWFITYHIIQVVLFALLVISIFYIN